MSIEQQLPVSLAAKDDPEAKAWLQANHERNSFDPAVLDYPCTVILKVEDSEKVRGYMPIQNAVMLESIGLNARLSALEAAEAVMNMIAAAIRLGHDIGIRECYFLATDEVTARGAEQMGFEALPYQLYRLKIAKIMEAQNVEDRPGLHESGSGEVRAAGV